MIETIQVKGLPSPPWYKKINPLWWLGNDECKPTESFWYCYVRNPAQNFRKYVIGVADRDRSIRGPAPAGLNFWHEGTDPNHYGWKWAISMKVLPYVSYDKSSGFAFYLGWLPDDGRFGARLTW